MDEREKKELQSFNSVHFQLTRVLSVIRASVIMHSDSEKFGRLPFPHSTHNLIFTNKAQNDNAGFKIIHDSSTRCHTVIGHGKDRLVRTSNRETTVGTKFFHSYACALPLTDKFFNKQSNNRSSKIRHTSHCSIES